MTSRRLHVLLCTLLLAVSAPVVADEVEDPAVVEARKQEAFQDGFSALVNDLNRQYTGSFDNSIDREEMVDRIYGLRLIDQRIKRQLEDNLENSFGPMVGSGETGFRPHLFTTTQACGTTNSLDSLFATRGSPPCHAAPFPVSLSFASCSPWAD